MEVTYIVDKEKVLKEVRRLTTYVGQRKGEDGAFERISATDSDREMLEQFWQAACSSATEELMHYAIDIYIGSVCRESEYEVEMDMPSMYDDNLNESVESSLQNFFVNLITSKWCKITNPDDEAKYAAEALGFIRDIDNKIYQRKRPTRENAYTERICSNSVVAPAPLNSYYKKPKDGIPKTDLAEDVCNSLRKADTAIQDISGKQDILISGTTIKTINHKSLLGSGNIQIQGGGDGDASTYIINTTKYGITEGSMTKDGNGHYSSEQYDAMYNNYLGFNQAFKDARDAGVSKVIVPKGIYCFCPVQTTVNCSQILQIYEANNIEFDFSGSTFRLCFDSTQRSQYHTYNPTKVYDTNALLLAVVACTNITIENLTMIGDRLERSYIEAGEKRDGQTWGICAGIMNDNIEIRNCDLSNFMASGIGTVGSYQLSLTERININLSRIDPGVFVNYGYYYKYSGYTVTKVTSTASEFYTLSGLIDCNLVYTENFKAASRRASELSEKKIYALWHNSGYSRLIDCARYVDILTYETSEQETPSRILEVEQLSNFQLEGNERYIRIQCHDEIDTPINLGEDVELDFGTIDETTGEVTQGGNGSVYTNAIYATDFSNKAKTFAFDLNGVSVNKIYGYRYLDDVFVERVSVSSAYYNAYTFTPSTSGSKQYNNIRFVVEFASEQQSTDVISVTWKYKHLMMITYAVCGTETIRNNFLHNNFRGGVSSNDGDMLICDNVFKKTYTDNPPTYIAESTNFHFDGEDTQGGTYTFERNIFISSKDCGIGKLLFPASPKRLIFRDNHCDGSITIGKNFEAYIYDNYFGGKISFYDFIAENGKYNVNGGRTLRRKVDICGNVLSGLAYTNEDNFHTDVIASYNRFDTKNGQDIGSLNTKYNGEVSGIILKENIITINNNSGYKSIVQYNGVNNIIRSESGLSDICFPHFKDTKYECGTILLYDDEIVNTNLIYNGLVVTGTSGNTYLWNTTEFENCIFNSPLCNRIYVCRDLEIIFRNCTFNSLLLNSASSVNAIMFPTGTTATCKFVFIDCIFNTDTLCGKFRGEVDVAVEATGCVAGTNEEVTPNTPFAALLTSSDSVAAYKKTLVSSSSGASTERPKFPPLYYCYFDTTLGYPIYANAVDDTTGDVTWIDGAGNEV